MKKITLSIAFTSLIALHHMQARATNHAPYYYASFDETQMSFVDDHINSVAFRTINNNSGAQYMASQYVLFNILNIPKTSPGNTITNKECCLRKNYSINAVL
jgi:hypothetical protein